MGKAHEVSDLERSKAVVRAFVEAINARAWDRLDELVAHDFVRHSHAAGPQVVRGREDLKRYLRGEFETFPDALETFEDLVAEESKVAARHRLRGTQRGPLGPYPPTGRLMTAEYLAIYRLEGGRIVEAWAEWDNLSGLTQLGHHQPPPERWGPPPGRACKGSTGMDDGHPHGPRWIRTVDALRP